MTGRGSWPYYPEQCPRCWYCHRFDSTHVDDSGYEIIGFCRNPRIGMELFRPREERLREAGRCPLFVLDANIRL